ncbi:MAG: fused MFS/spermidine synthase [Rhodocyclaceae bacterium]|nr:fused MFS/spermidine synthase [Rhodocyclaceae bacterium]
MSHSIEVSEDAGVRYLHFGSSWIQGAMRVARPYALELEYTREMMAALLLRPSSEYPGWPRRVLLIGLGAGSLTKFLWRQRPESRLTVVEINPAVVGVAYASFRLPDDPERIRIELADGVKFVAEDQEEYDLILVDGFDDKARAGKLDAVPFYAACRRRLASDGLMVVNLLGHYRGFKGAIERISEAFEGRALLFPSCDSGNAIAFAAVGDPVAIPLTELKSNAQALKRDAGLNLLPTLARLQEAASCKEGVLRL